MSGPPGPLLSRNWLFETYEPVGVGPAAYLGVRPTGARLLVGLAAILNSKYVNRSAPRSAKSDAPIADPQPVGAAKFPLQRLDVAIAGFRETCQSQKNPHSGVAFDCAQLGAGARCPDKM